VDHRCHIGHEDLKDNIWRNNDESRATDVTDDKNGYVDDVNGLTST